MVFYLKINETVRAAMHLSFYAKPPPKTKSLFLMINHLTKLCCVLCTVDQLFTQKLGCTIRIGKGERVPRLNYLHSDITNFFLAVQ